MSFLGRDKFARDVVVLFLVGVVLAALFSSGLALTTGKYFAKAITQVIGDYGQYDLVFSVRTELRDATISQLRQVLAERFPGSRLKPGLSVAGKSTIFLSFAPAYRTGVVFESLPYYFGNLPANAAYSIISEPRIVISSVPGGAQEILRAALVKMPGVAFVFLDGDSLNIQLREAKYSDRVRAGVNDLLRRYQLLEVRFPVDQPVTDIGALGRQLEQAVKKAPGVTMAKDVTRGGNSNDMEYMASALGELRRFMTAYASRVTVRPIKGKTLTPGDRLVLQGQAARLPRPGQRAQDQFVVVKLDQVKEDDGTGLIIQGDASFIKNTSAFRLLPGEKVGEYVGTTMVADERAALSHALDESVKLLRQVATIAGDPSWDISGSLQKYQGVMDQILGVQKLLTTVRGSVGVATAAETRTRLHEAALQISAISGDLAYLSQTMVRVKLAENKVSGILDQLGLFGSLLGNPAGQAGLETVAGGLSQQLLGLERGLTAAGENLRQRARQIDDFINRFNPLVQILQGWGDRARILAKQLDAFSSAMAPGGKGYQSLDSLLGATDSALSQLRSFDSLGLLQTAAESKGQVAALGRFDLNTIIEQMELVKESLPRLLDEEIGRSVGVIDRYLGTEAAPGARIQILANAGASTSAMTRVIREVSGRRQADVLRLTVGAMEMDFRGEIYRVLAEVRTTITALMLLTLFLLEFLLDQTVIIAMLRRQAGAVSRRLVGARPRLARLTAFLLNPARAYAALFGALWLGAGFLLAGARLPLLGSSGALIAGAALGLALSPLAERINPINTDEIMAGESLGLPFVSLMREIVIPAGRPGLLQILNRRRLVMRGKENSRC